MSVPMTVNQPYAPDSAILDAGFDQPGVEGGPRRYLVLCTTPRTASHMLMAALYDLGLGVPTEYLNPVSIRAISARLGLPPPGDADSLGRYWSEVVRRRTRNEIFSVSLFGAQLRHLPALIPDGQPAVFVHLYRRDLAAQVASLLAVYETKQPYRNGSTVPDLPGISEVSGRAIRVLGRWIEQQNDRWRQFLQGRTHISIATEDFLADPAPSLADIVRLVQCQAGPDLLLQAARQIAAEPAYTVNSAAKARILAAYPDAFAALRT